VRGGQSSPNARAPSPSSVIGEFQNTTTPPTYFPASADQNVLHRKIVNPGASHSSIQFNSILFKTNRQTAVSITNRASMYAIIRSTLSQPAARSYCAKVSLFYVKAQSYKARRVALRKSMIELMNNYKSELLSLFCNYK